MRKKGLKLRLGFFFLPKKAYESPQLNKTVILLS